MQASSSLTTSGWVSFFLSTLNGTVAKIDILILFALSVFSPSLSFSPFLSAFSLPLSSHMDAYKYTLTLDNQLFFFFFMPFVERVKQEKETANQIQGYLVVSRVSVSVRMLVDCILCCTITDTLIANTKHDINDDKNFL